MGSGKNIWVFLAGSAAFALPYSNPNPLPHSPNLTFDLCELQEDKMATLKAINSNESATHASAVRVDMKLEVVIIPVSDVDRAKEFYARLGWRLDADFTAGNDWRGVQFTPPGSGCSVIFGKNVTTATPGSAQGLYLAVSDIESARKELLRRGVEVSEVFHGSNVHAGSDEPYLFGRLRISGPDPAHTSYSSFASFRDPDGNGWLLQEITARLPGRGVSNFDVATMTELLRETEEHHGQYEPTAPKHHWSGWYAAFMVARQDGKTPEEAAQEAKLHIEGALAA
jgi:catechol 2,3-dioxygenase-like lactoylglutathione lyase family enzyme